MKGNITLSGKLGFFDLSEVLQLLAGKEATGYLQINDVRSVPMGNILFSEGELIDGESGSLGGLDALYNLMGRKYGYFEFYHEPVHVERRIKAPLMQVILEASKRLDERTEDENASRFLTFNQNKTEHLPVINGPNPDYDDIIDTEIFRESQQIVRSGAAGNWIWVILDGTVEVTKEVEQKSVQIARLGKGSYIGTLSHFLKGVNKRSASVTAMEDVELGLVDSRHLCREYLRLSPIFKDLILRQDQLLKRITSQLIQLHISTSQEFFQGEPMDIDLNRDLWKIRHGKVNIVKKGKGKDRLVFSLIEGDVLGKTKFANLDYDSQYTLVLPSQDLALEKLDPNSLAEEYDGLSDTFKGLIDHVIICIHATIRSTCLSEVWEVQKPESQTADQKAIPISRY